MDNSQYSFDYDAAGADAQAKIANGGTECFVKVRTDYWLLTQVGGHEVVNRLGVEACMEKNGDAQGVTRICPRSVLAC